MDDLISRKQAFKVLTEYYHQRTEIQHIALKEALDRVPDAVPFSYRWCTDCKEYDHEKHYCPRFNSVIAKTIKDLKGVQEYPCDGCIYELLPSENYPCTACSRYYFDKYTDKKGDSE